MKQKNLLRALLFPPFAVMLILLPVSAVFLVYAMIFLGTTSLVAVVSYVLAAYTLTIWCLRIPQLVRIITAFKTENRFVRRWQDDTRLRVNVSLYGSLMWNTAYAVFQLGLGFYHASFWFFSMACYYLSLAAMRFYLVRYTGRNTPGHNPTREWQIYSVCGRIFLLMNLAVSLMIFFMVYWNRTFIHHEITTIAMAAYTFTALTVAIINLIRYRRYNSPVYSASKAISLAAACVSMLTLESTMLTTFGDGTTDLFTRRIFLGATGAAVSIVIVIISVNMIVCGNRRLQQSNQ